MGGGVREAALPSAAALLLTPAPRPSQLLGWVDQGILECDAHSRQSAAILSSEPRLWPLAVDPHGAAGEWIRRTEAAAATGGAAGSPGGGLVILSAATALVPPPPAGAGAAGTSAASPADAPQLQLPASPTAAPGRTASFSFPPPPLSPARAAAAPLASPGTPGTDASTSAAADQAAAPPLVDAVRYGRAVLLEGLAPGAADPGMLPLLRCSLGAGASGATVVIGGRPVDYDPAFHLFLATPERVPHALPPDVLAAVAPIDFAVSPAALAARMLDLIVEAEAPAVAAEAARLRRARAVALRELASVHEAMLDTISAQLPAAGGGGSSSSSSGGMLDNDSLLASLTQRQGLAAQVRRGAGGGAGTVRPDHSACALSPLPPAAARPAR